MQYQRSLRLDFPAQTVFDWHGRIGALQRQFPSWSGFSLVQEDAEFESGKRYELSLPAGWPERRWSGKYALVEPGKRIVDTQARGPFGAWTRRLEFVFLSERESELVETVDWEPPSSKVRGKRWIDETEKWVARWVAFRQERVAADLRFRRELGSEGPRRVLISGGTGFLGTHLGSLLGALGLEVWTLTRRKPGPRQIRWNPEHGEIEMPRLEGFDALVHLAGASLMGGRWTEARKKEIRNSRVDSTRFLVEALGRLRKPPGILLSGSGIGFYGSHPEKAVDEATPQGEGFLADVCADWEKAASKASGFVERVAFLRTGVALDPLGGALQQMLPAFRFGLGGPLGGGRQWFPWIALEDWIRAVAWCLFRRQAAGPINLVGPEPIRQGQFAEILGEVIGRPVWLPVPRFGLKALFGEMADEALLSSVNAVPRRLRELGYPFAFADAKSALRNVLNGDDAP